MNAAKQVTVTIIRDQHEHAGKPVAKGSRLLVDEITARWLIDHHIGVVATAATIDSTKKESK